LVLEKHEMEKFTSLFVDGLEYRPNPSLSRWWTRRIIISSFFILSVTSFNNC
jgi:hypothetical protein